MNKRRRPELQRRGPLGRYLVLTVAWSCCTAPAIPADAIAELLSGFTQHPHQQARFVEQTYSRVLKRPSETTGELYFDAPDRLEKRTLTPVRENLLVEGENVTVSRGAHRRSLRIADIPPLRPLLEGLRATLAGDLAGLSGHFAVSAAATDAGWLLTLRPLPNEPQPLYRRIQIRGRDGRVQSLEIERDTGERSVMTITTVEPP
jgi:Outer membrane lipoprotein carrier protein LolA-like